MDSVLVWLTGQSWFIYVATVVTIATSITAILPSTWKENKYYGYFMSVINLLAGAVGRGKPADAKK